MPSTRIALLVEGLIFKTRIHVTVIFLPLTTIVFYFQFNDWSKYCKSCMVCNIISRVVNKISVKILLSPLKSFTFEYKVYVHVHVYQRQLSLLQAIPYQSSSQIYIAGHCAPSFIQVCALFLNALEHTCNLYHRSHTETARSIIRHNSTSCCSCLMYTDWKVVVTVLAIPCQDCKQPIHVLQTVDCGTIILGVHARGLQQLSCVSVCVSVCVCVSVTSILPSCTFKRPICGIRGYSAENAVKLKSSFRYTA